MFRFTSKTYFRAQDLPPVVLRLPVIPASNVKRYDEQHIFYGAINKSGKPVGKHALLQGGSLNQEVLLRQVHPPDQAGIGLWSVSINGRTKRSTTFPANLTEDQIKAHIEHALKYTPSLGPDGLFIGDSGRGYKIRGYFRGGEVKSAFPLRSQIAQESQESRSA